MSKETVSIECFITFSIIKLDKNLSMKGILDNDDCKHKNTNKNYLRKTRFVFILCLPSDFKLSTSNGYWTLRSIEIKNRRIQAQSRTSIPRSGLVILHWTEAHAFCCLFNRPLYDHRHAGPGEFLHSSGKRRANWAVCNHSVGRQRIPARCH